MATKKSPPATSPSRGGRPRLVESVKRTTVHFDEVDLERFALMRQILAKAIPTPMSDQQLLRVLMVKGFEAFQREHGVHPELPLKELPLKESSTTKKSK